VGAGPPGPEEPVTHVWAEGPSDARARTRAQQYAVRLRQLLLVEARRRARAGRQERWSAAGRSCNVLAYEHPEDLRYSSDHEWGPAGGHEVRVGITDYAKTPSVMSSFVDLPAVGAEVSVGGSSARSSPPSRLGGLRHRRWRGRRCQPLSSRAPLSKLNAIPTVTGDLRDRSGRSGPLSDTLLDPGAYRAPDEA